MHTTAAPAAPERATSTGTVIPASGRGEVMGGQRGGDDPGGCGSGSGVEARMVKGRRCTNRRGAGEYLGRSLQTINLVASPKKREATGWPAYVDIEDGQEWYAFDDLDTFRVSYLEAKQRDRQARVHQVTLDGDPDELITAKEFYTIIGVDARTWSKYVEKSIPDWENDRDGYLLKPDREEPGRGGVVRKWKRQRAAMWINNRSGSASSPGRPKQAPEPEG